MCKKHIPDLLETGFFTGARFQRAETGKYRICYEAIDKAALDEYLATKAAALREDFAAHFTRGISVSRVNWEVLEQFSSRL